MIASEKLIKYCIKENIKIVTMESCTGGALVDELTNVTGASDVVKDSFVTYSNDAKIKLGVGEETINEYSVYSEEVAKEMAENAIKNSVSKNNIVGVGITGSLTRTDPNNKNSIPGKIHFAIKYRDKIYSETIKLEENLTRVESNRKIINYIIKKILEFL